MKISRVCFECQYVILVHRHQITTHLSWCDQCICEILVLLLPEIFLVCHWINSLELEDCIGWYLEDLGCVARPTL
jgi:hypothetical protein